jgi:hypothetical protein
MITSLIIHDPDARRVPPCECLNLKSGTQLARTANSNGQVSGASRLFWRIASTSGAEQTPTTVVFSQERRIDIDELHFLSRPRRRLMAAINALILMAMSIRAEMERDQRSSREVADNKATP